MGTNRGYERRVQLKRMKNKPIKDSSLLQWMKVNIMTPLSALKWVCCWFVLCLLVRAS